MARERVAICEVGPRDGLQNESVSVAPAVRAGFIRRLALAGLRCIEAGSFVSPRAIPQMVGTDEVMALLADLQSVRLPVLVANERGLTAALAAGVREIAVFTGTTDSFVRRNIHCSVAESLQRFAPLVRAARNHGLDVRGYVSMAFGCPYEGAVAPGRVAEIAAALLRMGCGEISLGDTIGVATPPLVRAVLDTVLTVCPAAQLAGHFHDTRGTAVANVAAALELGLRSFDGAVGGLGGCPYAPGAAGNVATEALVSLCEGAGFDTGVDLPTLAAAGAWIDAQLGRNSRSGPNPTLAQGAAKPSLG
jgi:hydroxymethylglutaryl-CoA lyase